MHGVVADGATTSIGLCGCGSSFCQTQTGRCDASNTNMPLLLCLLVYDIVCLILQFSLPIQLQRWSEVTQECFVNHCLFHGRLFWTAQVRWFITPCCVVCQGRTHTLVFSVLFCTHMALCVCFSSQLPNDPVVVESQCQNMDKLYENAIKVT